MWTYAAIVPGTLPFVLLTRALARLGPRQLFPGAALLTTVALLIDGIVVAFVPAIYSEEPALLARIAAAILWGGGVGLALAWILDRRA